MIRRRRRGGEGESGHRNRRPRENVHQRGETERGSVPIEPSVDVSRSGARISGALALRGEHSVIIDDRFISIVLQIILILL